jgi:tetratricopeptide (TPR) repeat protein
LSRVGRFQEAAEVYDRLRDLTDDQNINIFLEARADELHGVLALRHRRIKEARAYFNSAKDKLEVMPLFTQDDYGEYESELSLSLTLLNQRLRNSLAGLLLREGKFVEAAKSFEDNLKEVTSLGKEVVGRITNNELAEVYNYLGRYEEAINMALVDLQRAQKTGHLEAQVNQLRILGNACRLKKDYEQARFYYEKGLQLCRRHYFFEHQLRIQNSLANVFWQTQKWAEAIAEYKPALDLAMRLEGKASAVDMMTNIGRAYNNLHKYEDAIEYLELAVDFAKKPEAESSIQIRRIMPYIYVELAHACLQKKRINKAQVYLNQALNSESYAEFDDLVKYNLHGTLLEVNLAQNKLEEAQKQLPYLEKLAQNIPQAQEHLKELKQRVEEFSPKVSDA